MKNVIVTGATSFIGSQVIKVLLSEGIKVYAIVRPESSNIHQLYHEIRDVDKDRIHIVECDLKNISSLNREMLTSDDHVGFDGWIQTAWEGAGSDNRRKQDVQQMNVVYSMDCLRKAVELGCRRFLFTGSQAEYGIKHEIIHEDIERNPISEYGKAKVAFSIQAQEYCRTHEVDYIHARIFSIYGPGDHPWSLVQSCIKTWKEEGHMSFGECSQLWNFLYVTDAAKALVKLLIYADEGFYNVAGTETIPLRDYIGRIYQACGKKGTYQFGERNQNAEGAADLNPDIHKLCNAIDWKPEVDFEEGIHETMHIL